MLTVSLHGIKIHAPHGLYPEEHILGNSFVTDVDIWLPDTLPWPFADYTLIQKTVSATFLQPGQLLESTGDLLAAREAYRQGIDAAARKGDQHAGQEIAAALAMIE